MISLTDMRIIKVNHVSENFTRRNIGARIDSENLGRVCKVRQIN